MEFPLISIIVPIFNVEKFIPECIESIQKQSYTNMQVILVDDGSTDSSGKICDKYASGDARIEVIHQQNKGLVAARKSGLKKAKGKYIGFVDGDDYIDSDMYQTLVREMEETKVDFVHCRYWEKNSTIRSSEKKVINLSVERISFLENTILG
ncbi:MAG: glycosyltransferase, partial [Anaeroplasmataceae bacterium]|nr:glycosyltransferase [Anaeroplasmataceae bacterium]